MSHTRAQQEMMRLQLARTTRRDRTLPARRLVEFRCRGPKPGHLLAVIYGTLSGPLAVSTADVVFDAVAQRNQRMREFAAEHPNVTNPMRPAWLPSPRLVEVDEPFSDDPMPINCRCGSWPDLTRDILRTALGLLGEASAGPVVLGVSVSGVRGPGGTLCAEF
jgi:hypothetical protein